MFYYPVLTTKKLPVIFYYSSPVELSIGQIVIVPLQSQLIEGIIFQTLKTENEILEMSIELDKIKEISEIKPFILHTNQIQFIKFLINNTFGNPGIILATFLQSFKLLSMSSWKILQTNYEKKNLEQKNSENNLVSNLENSKIPNEKEKILNSKNILSPNIQNKGKSEKLVDYLTIQQKQQIQNIKPEFNFWLEQDYTLRIIYIIRNWKQKEQKRLEINSQILDPKINVEKDLEILADSQKTIRKNSFQKLSQNDKKSIFDIVVIFPEKKLLDKVYKNLEDLTIWKNFLHKLESENWILENYFFSSQINKESRQTILELLGIESQKTKKSKPGKKLEKKTSLTKIPEYSEKNLQTKIEDNFKKDTAQHLTEKLNYKIRLTWGTRSSLFLPFANLSSIILIDEANSFHIQEQNGLYFDTREAVFLVHRACGIDLDFVSILPSVRFQNFYQSKNLTTQNNSNNIKHKINSTFDNSNNQKNCQIKITKFNKKYDNYQLFSNQIEQLLQNDQEDFEYFDED